MNDTKLRQIRILNVAFAGSIFMLALVFAKPIFFKNNLEVRNLELSLRTCSDSDLYSLDKKDYGNVFLNSVDKAVELISISKSKDGKCVEFKVAGEGYIDEGRFVFNGARVLIGQKAEIHSKYFIQGKIIKVEYEESL